MVSTTAIPTATMTPTATTASTAAMNAVFGTAELLEEILITAMFQGMTHKELLLAQRVSTDWKATIEDSPRLQKLLGFRPATTSQDIEFLRQWSAQRILLGDDHDDLRGMQTVLHDDDREDSFHVFINPLAESVLGDGVPEFPIADVSVARDSKDICSDEALQNYRNSKTTGQIYTSERMRRQDLDKHDFLTAGPKRMVYETWSQTTSSFHRMLLTQPPPVLVHLDYSDKNCQYTTKAVKNPTGVTLGDIWQAGTGVDVPYDQKRGCDLDPQYDYAPDTVDKLVTFWAQTGEYDDESDSEEDSDMSDEEYDTEYDWEDYYGGDWSDDEGSEDSEDEDENGEDDDLDDD